MQSIYGAILSYIISLNCEKFIFCIYLFIKYPLMSIDFDSLLKALIKRYAGVKIFMQVLYLCCVLVSNILRDRDQLEISCRMFLVAVPKIFQTVWGYEGIDFFLICIALVITMHWFISVMFKFVRNRTENHFGGRRWNFQTKFCYTVRDELLR